MRRTALPARSTLRAALPTRTALHRTLLARTARRLPQPRSKHVYACRLLGQDMKLVDESKRLATPTARKALIDLLFEGP